MPHGQTHQERKYAILSTPFYEQAKHVIFWTLPNTSFHEARSAHKHARFMEHTRTPNTRERKRCQAHWRVINHIYEVDIQKQSPWGVLLKGVFRNFAKFTGKYLCQSLFFNKVAGLRPSSYLKKRPWHRCFPVIWWNFLEHFSLQVAAS